LVAGLSTLLDRASILEVLGLLMTALLFLVRNFFFDKAYIKTVLGQEELGLIGAFNGRFSTQLRGMMYSVLLDVLKNVR